MRKTVYMISAMLGAAGWVGAAAVTDHFESYTAGTSPAGQNGWTTANVKTGGTTTQNALAVRTTGIDGKPTQAIHIKDDCPEGGILQLGASFPVQNSFQIQFDVKLNGHLQLPVLHLGGVHGLKYVQTGMTLALDGGKPLKFSYHDGAEWQQIAIRDDADNRLNEGAWYTIRLTAPALTGNKAADTWSLTVKDACGQIVVQETGLAFRSGLTALNTAIFQFNIDSSGGDMLIDNFSVVKPAPAPGEFFIVGAIGLPMVRQMITY